MTKITQNNRWSPVFLSGAALCFVLLFVILSYDPSNTSLREYQEPVHFAPFYGQNKATDRPTVQNKLVGESIGEEWRQSVNELVERLPGNFSSSYRNPCWYEDDTLRCLPYFYQLGSYKCGTTDLWDKVVQHPHVLKVAKEPHWWAWRRFGYTNLPIHADLVLKIREMTGDRDDHSLQWYLNLYSYQATQAIIENTKLVFGDASISNLWGLGDHNWKKRFPELEEPQFFLANIIRNFQPNAKLTVILRDPVEKLWTTYMLGNRYKTMSFKKHFDNLLRASVDCEKKHSFTYCAFVHGSSPSTILGNHLYQGIYYVYLREWVTVFGADNIHVIRLEDWKNDTVSELNSVFQYLELDPLPAETMKSIVERSAKNVNKKAKTRNIVMSKEMRKRVQSFYRPWNEKLVELMGDEKFRWHY